MTSRYAADAVALDQARHARDLLLAGQDVHDSYVWPLPIPGNVHAELRIIGDELRTADTERLKKQIDLLLEALAEDPAPEA